jgi:acid phosphatase type 7
MKYKNLFTLFTFGISLALCSACAGEEGGAAKFTRAPYVQLATESSQVIVWRIKGEMKPVVRIGAAVDQLKAVDSAEVKILAKGDGEIRASRGTIQYEAYLSGLEADTIYYYAIYDGDQRLTPSDASYSFKTHPEIGSKSDSKFWIVGDSGTGGENQKAVYDGFRKYLGDQRLDGYLHVGDMAYGSGTDREFSDKFFPVYEETLRNTVCWASMGNHEGKSSKGESATGPYYDAYVLPANAEAGGVASGTETYYSFDYGNVHFICLNSHDLDRSPTAAMAQWLKADLEKTKAAWVVAFFHHPPYTKGSHDSDTEEQLIEMRENIMPILESGGVDVIFNGHSHIYERSMLIDGAYQTPSVSKGVVLDDGDGNPREGGDGSYKKSEGLAPNNGTVVVVAGHGGASLRKKGEHVLMSRVIMMHGSVIMETKGNQLRLKMISFEGEEEDYCVIEKGGVVERSIVVNPREPVLKVDPKWAAKMNAEKKRSKMPKKHQPIIKRYAEWEYLAGVDLHPAKGWKGLEFDSSQWKKGKAGFGYSDKDDNTILEMRNKYTVVYTRKEFVVDDLSKLEGIGLAAKYDDGFIAYLNGVEVVRSLVDFGEGANAKGFHKHEADRYEFFPLDSYRKHFKKGKNVLAIEGHNADMGSSDFTLDVFLTIKK